MLQENKIKFIKHYKFKNQSKDIKNFKYDFFIPELNTIIEYQGAQHYKFVKHFHKTNDNSLKRWYYDIFKREFCLGNNINFIEIRFDEDVRTRLEIENIILI